MLYKDSQVLGALFLPMLPNYHLPSLMFYLERKREHKIKKLNIFLIFFSKYNKNFFGFFGFCCF